MIIEVEKEKEYKHRASNVKISDELTTGEKEFILAMQEWKEYIQIPMLTEKIMILNKRIKRLSFWTSFYSVVLIILTLVLVIFGIIPLLND